MFFRRLLAPHLKAPLQRGKSILLLGPRQVGKTTLLSELNADLRISLITPRVRSRYEKDPSLLADEIRALSAKTPLVIVDEVQKVPELMDVAQELIDAKEAQLILTGSSARKLRHSRNSNLLPGRVVQLRLDPLTLAEDPSVKLEDLLVYGALPGIRAISSNPDRGQDLASYVETYLEEEIRAEALVRNMAHFHRFLELAALESGHIVNFSKIASEVGVSPLTIQSYYGILEDCLIAERVDPITRSATRKKLTKSSRYLIFDTGVRRLAAREGIDLGALRLGEYLEEWVGLELIRNLRLQGERGSLKFWRDPDGPEVDWVLEQGNQWTPIEVKWTERPQPRDWSHLATFRREYRQSGPGYVICRCARRQKLADGIFALPWTETATLLK